MLWLDIPKYLILNNFSFQVRAWIGVWVFFFGCLPSTYGQHAPPINFDLWNGSVDSKPKELKNISISGQPTLFFTAGFPTFGIEPGRGLGNNAQRIGDPFSGPSGSEAREYVGLNGMAYFL
ncbi:MAG: hypothetical protein HC880_06725 [Bacteroidia bacterium]|nr:hypothetical protein [Bacteroidia bacterium]